MRPRRAAGLIGVSLLASLGIAAAMLAPFFTDPAPDRIAGVVFRPGFGGGTGLSAIAETDPSARVVDVRWQGLLVFITYSSPDVPTVLLRRGALHLFDAIAAGCHTDAVAATRVRPTG